MCRWSRSGIIIPACVLLCSLAGTSCSSPTPPPAPPAKSPAPAATAPSTAQAAPSPQPATGGHLRVSMTVTTLSGEPLAGMNPIATRKPNAFDKPLSVGSLTDAAGRAELQVICDQTLFIRSWDPMLKWFPNNFLEVPPGAGSAASEATITMVPAATLLAQFTLPDNTPAANQAVSLMMVHATWGPWWPAESQTDAGGQALFPSVPPGVYDLQFKLGTGQTGSAAGAEIRPGAQVDLAIIPLQ